MSEKKSAFEIFSKDELVEILALQGIIARKRSYTKEELCKLLEVTYSKGKEITQEEIDGLVKSLEKKNENKNKTGEGRDKSAREATRKKLITNEGSKRTAKAPEGRDIQNDVLMPTNVKNSPAVLKIDGSGRTEADDIEQAELMQSFSNPYYTLRGKIAGIEATQVLSFSNGAIQNVNAIVPYGNRTVYIPCFALLQNYGMEGFDKNKVYQYMQYRIGQDVEFTVVDVADADKGIYYGSTLAASKFKRCKFWYSTAGNGEKYRVDVGDVVEAKIVSVSDTNVIVDVFGAETSVPLEEVSHQYILRAKDLYHAGDTEYVKIMSCKRAKLPETKKGYEGFEFPISYKASIKAAHINPKERYWEQITEHNTYKCTVVRLITDKSPIKVYCTYQNKVTIDCVLGKNYNFRIPKPGDEVIVDIYGKNHDKLWIWGGIIHLMEDHRDRDDLLV